MPKARRRTKTRAASKRRPNTSASRQRATTTRRRRRNPIFAAKRSARRSTRRRSSRNPAAALSGPIQIGVGAVLSQVAAGFIPFGGASPLFLAGKAVLAGYLLEYAGKSFRPLQTVTAQARTGGVAAATITLLNAYVMPTLLRYVNGVIAPPKANGGSGVNGFMVIPGGGGRALLPVQPVAPTSQRGVNGVMVVPRNY